MNKFRLPWPAQNELYGTDKNQSKKPTHIPFREWTTKQSIYGQEYIFCYTATNQHIYNLKLQLLLQYTYLKIHITNIFIWFTVYSNYGNIKKHYILYTILYIKNLDNTDNGVRTQAKAKGWNIQCTLYLVYIYIYIYIFKLHRYHRYQHTYIGFRVKRPQSSTPQVNNIYITYKELLTDYHIAIHQGFIFW